MKQFVRFLPPILAVVFLFLTKTEFLRAPKDGFAWKAIGLLLPTLWLTGVGPSHLVEGGGFLMQLIGITSSRQRVALVGLIWLCVFLLCAFMASSSWLKANSYQAKVNYMLAYAGLMSALGVYAFLAVCPETKN
jgi:hypothetical protein